jgi:hypothetical protein
MTRVSLAKKPGHPLLGGWRDLVAIACRQFDDELRRLR